MNTTPVCRKARKLTVALWLIALSVARAQTAVEAWVQRYAGPGNADDRAASMALDGNDNVIVTGYSQSDASASSADYITVKYSSTGVPLWTNRYDGPGGASDRATAVAVDGSGNVLVTGSSAGSSGFSDYATIKYSATGVPLWTNRYNGPENSDDDATALAVDGNGNVFVTGASYSFGIVNPDYATTKYSGAGEPLWTNRYDALENNDARGQAVTVDGDGNAIVTGWPATIKYSGAGVALWTNSISGGAHAVDGSGNVVVVVSGLTNYDYATLKCSEAGVPLWTNIYDGPGNFNDNPTAVAVDGSGNVFVTGDSWGSGSGVDYATIAYSSAGSPLWTNRYNGPTNSFDYAMDVAVDASGNVAVTGGSYNGYANDYVTIKYSSTGVPLWTNRYTGPANAGGIASAVAMDASGNVFVTGASWNGSDYDYVTIKYSDATLFPIPLNYQIVGTQLVLSWTNAAFSLQRAPAVQGTYTNVSGVTSPFTNPVFGSQQFFRLIAN
jgi:hypothetical protein